MPRPPALSPSRANDFRQCPLMFRLRVIDQIPEPASPAATLGTLVHGVLEDLYSLDPADRTEARTVEMLEPAWRAMLAADAALTDLHADATAERAWLAEAAARVRTYFTLENPERLEPAAREELVEFELEDGPLLRGVIDRVDVAPDGSIRIVDYKTGKTPPPQYGQQAKFQMRFYALLVERTRQRAPDLMQLLYLRDGGTVVLRPTPEDLAAIEFEVRQLWAEITAVARAADWRPRKSKLCPWCSFQSLCPEFGGSAPGLDPALVEPRLGVRLAD